jgi:tetratricopeptide (TPR) repeat protein
MCYDFTFWGRGALAHDADLIRSELDEKPFILYFHIRKSEWCEKMTNVYLASTQVEDFLRNFNAVEISPDRGADEGAIASKYKIGRYPTFLVFVPAFESKPHIISPFSKKKTMTVDEFIQAIIKAIIHPYHQQGFSYYEKKEYDKSIKYFKITLDYDPKYVPAYHAIAVMQHTMGLEQKDLDLLKNAEENLLKALEIDPNNKMAKKELENVKKNVEVIGRK